MKILLNGATGGTNFGDFLFAKIFHEEAVSLIGGDNVFWYDSRYCLSNYFKKQLKCNSRKHKLSDIDALVCISGGYFCGNDTTLRLSIIRYLRYFHLCIRCIIRKIPIAIIGVDVAKHKFNIIDKIQKFILKRAELVVVRNRESLDQLRVYGVENPICTADTAHVMTSDFFSDCVVQNDVVQLKGKKMFFHVQPSKMRDAEKLVPVIDYFLLSHPEYSVVVGMDQYWGDDDFLEEFVKRFSSKNVVINHFYDPIALCKVLDTMDVIVTPKLHVGIVGATLSKSVISFSCHTEKITRFYRQIGEEKRTLSMEYFSETKAFDMLEKYHAIPIVVSDDILKMAQSNLDYFKNFISNLSSKKAKS
ncbi:MAG: polysaccharide pyruvyl transferase family protein [Clostridia bacterium]|nr:polysaccharide pyruvyl transferase family protein [Clostridia bacterium]